MLTNIYGSLAKNGKGKAARKNGEISKALFKKYVIRISDNIANEINIDRIRMNPG